MIDAGINDGDVVVIREAARGQRRYRRGTGRGSGGDAETLSPQGRAIALEAANPAYETRVFRDDQVKVQGRLVGLIRTY